MNGIFMDGRLYRVRVVYNTMERSFDLRSGDNEGYMLSDLHTRDLIGTRYSYKMNVEPDPRFPRDYDAFLWAISAPVDSHPVTLPFGQGLLTFEAEVQDGTDTWKGRTAWTDRWNGLTVSFTPIAPQRTPDQYGLPPGILLNKNRRPFLDRLGRIVVVGLK